MPVRVQWLDDDKWAVHVHFEGEWQIAEARTARQQVGELVADVTHEVDVIFDFSDANKIPSNMLSAMRTGGQNRTTTPQLSDRVVVVGTSQLIRTLVEVARRIYLNALPVSIQFADTLDEAANLLRTMRDETSNETQDQT